MEAKRSNRVFVGMSGGVDSSVSAALLKKAGYDVTGVFIKVWQPDWMACTWKDERREAMRAAAHLKLPFVTLDLEKEYKQGVVDHMIKEYSLGLTPNPDVMCNREVKFGAFAKWAKANGADFIATGHYARNILNKDGSHSLLAGSDLNKDQSYFLWTLKQEDLDHILFPVGHLIKEDVRKLARRFGLPNAEKKDSQGLCFMGKVDLKDFLSHYINSEPGDVLNESGERIGSHPGSFYFTIGERHGFSVNSHSSSGLPYFVTDKDAERNTITVSTKQKLAENGARVARIARMNWINGQAPNVGEPGMFALQARSRYRQALEDMRISRINISSAEIQFKDNQSALTPGQSLVIYDGEKCLGGGIIED